MASLKLGENLVVVGMAGPSGENFFLRTFRTFDGDADMSKTFIAEWTGGRARLLRSFGEEITGIAYSEEWGLLCLGQFGELHQYRAGAWARLAPPLEPRQRTSVLALRGERVFALGYPALLWELDRAGGAWRPIPVPPSDSLLVGMALPGNREMVVCGTRALALEGGPAAWSPIDAPTNRSLTYALAVGADVYITGQSAQALRRRDGDWLQLDAGEWRSNFVGLAWFQDQVLVAARDALLVVRGDALALFADRRSTILAVVGQHLLNIGFDSLSRFDGSRWEELTVEFEIPDAPPRVARPRQ